MEAVSCDICHSRQFDVVRQDRWVSPDLSQWFPVLTCVCQDCGHVYNNPCLTADEIRGFYRGQKRESFQVSRGESKGLNAADTNLLTSHTGKGNGRKALEVGCYTGYMSHRLQAEGWEVEGLEPNPDSAQVARDQFGIHVHECMLEDYDTDRRYDLLFMGGVLEHVRSPTEFLLRVNQLLNIGGYLYVRVPNLDDLEYDTAADLFILEHLHNFSSVALRMLFEKTGFETLITTAHDKFPRSFISIGRKTHDLESPAPFHLKNQKDQVKASITEYNRRIESERGKINQKLKPLLRDPKPRVVIYGAGSHTEILLRNTLLSDLNLVALVDSNPKKWGDTAFGFPVQNPETYDKNQADAVVISSRAFQEEIYQRIQHWEDESVQVIRLYDLESSRFAHE